MKRSGFAGSWVLMGKTRAALQREEVCKETVWVEDAGNGMPPSPEIKPLAAGCEAAIGSDHR
jgi:hypothetical protein